MCMNIKYKYEQEHWHDPDPDPDPERAVLRAAFAPSSSVSDCSGRRGLNPAASVYIL